MTEEQAAEVTLLLKAATGGRVEQSTVEYYNVALLPLDFNHALTAATIGTITWRKFPSWAEFKEIYRAQVRLAEPVGEQRNDPPSRVGEDPDFKRGLAAPEWVHVWYWSRVIRQPSENRGFPQQEGNVDPRTQMTRDDYEKVRVEWKEAGSPKYENPIPMAR